MNTLLLPREVIDRVSRRPRLVRRFARGTGFVDRIDSALRTAAFRVAHLIAWPSQTFEDTEAPE